MKKVLHAFLRCLLNKGAAYPHIPLHALLVGPVSHFFLWPVKRAAPLALPGSQPALAPWLLWRRRPLPPWQHSPKVHGGVRQIAGAAFGILLKWSHNRVYHMKRSSDVCVCVLLSLSCAGSTLMASMLASKQANWFRGDERPAGQQPRSLNTHLNFIGMLLISLCANILSAWETFFSISLKRIEFLLQKYIIETFAHIANQGRYTFFCPASKIYIEFFNVVFSM